MNLNEEVDLEDYVCVSPPARAHRSMVVLNAGSVIVIAFSVCQFGGSSVTHYYYYY